MKALLALAVVPTAAGLVGLLIGAQAAQTIGILLGLALITALAIAPRDI